MSQQPSFKDLFSQRSTEYARFRPDYPDELFGWLAAEAPGRRLAVDVGTGSGQAAAGLGAWFARVVGVDPSAEQIANARPHPAVEYRVGRAEATGLAGVGADLLTAAQALHWFDREAFFAEVRRVLRPGGLLALWCYGIAEITPGIDRVVHDLYEDRLGPYWEPERRLVEDGYRTIAFPFAEVAAPVFTMRLAWEVERLLGYLGTWSPIKRYVADKGIDPVAAIAPRLVEAWGAPPGGTREVRWPLGLRAFRI